MSKGGKREGSGRKTRNSVKRQFKISIENSEFLDSLPIGQKSKFVDDAIRWRNLSDNAKPQ
jgi:hypothetical protein